MRRITALALAAIVSAALLSSARAADDKDASKDKKDDQAATASQDKAATTTQDKAATATQDQDATQAAQSREGRGRGGRNAHATIAPSKAPGQDDVKGTVTFMAAEGGNGVKVHAEITGLEPGKHGFHIHEKGDLSDPELKSAGNHFNPSMHKHGGPRTGDHHAGDLGNIEADAQGKATYDATIEGITLDDSKTGIIGKSVVVHAKADDLKTDPAGDSGALIAAGVIERGRGGQGGQGGQGNNRGQQRGNRQGTQQGQGGQ